VFGAQAVVVYGVPRLSADVDITLALTPDDPEGFARDMQATGFALRVLDPDFVRRTRVMPFVHVPTGMPLDVVLAGSGLEDEFLDRAVATEIGPAHVPFIDVGDLIITKVLAGRPKDVDDVRALWRLHGQRIDSARIRRTLRLLERRLEATCYRASIASLVSSNCAGPSRGALFVMRAAAADRPRRAARRRRSTSRPESEWRGRPGP
jgi:hypothetical protein